MRQNFLSRILRNIRNAEDAYELSRSLDDLFDCREAYEISNFSDILLTLHGSLSIDDFEPTLAQRFLHWLARASTYDNLRRHKRIVANILLRVFSQPEGRLECREFSTDSFFHENLENVPSIQERNKRNLLRGILCSYQPPSKDVFVNFAWCKHVEFTCQKRFHNLLSVFLQADCPRGTIQQQAAWITSYYHGAAALFALAAKHRIAVVQCIQEREPSWMLTLRTTHLLRIAAENTEEEALLAIQLFVSLLDPNSRADLEMKKAILGHLQILATVFRQKNFLKAKEKVRNELARLRMLNTIAKISAQLEKTYSSFALLTS